MLIPGVDHLRHTHDLSRNAFSRGQPDLGAELADELESRIIPLHDASNIAALIVDPVAASGGVLVPPKGYLERLRDICTRHGILLIFDEVITGWGRLGATFAAQHLGIKPDLITFAKGITSGAVPLGGVLVRDSIYQTFMAKMKAGAWYVAEKRLESNELVVVQDHDHPLLMKNTLDASDASWVAGTAPEKKSVTAKTRYRQADARCSLERVLESEIRVGFEAPQWAVTPGQSVVLYAGEVCLGGGVIT